MEVLKVNRLLSTTALFSSASTLICCALPALFVALGMGAAFAGLVSAIPQLVWFSEHKGVVFPIAGLLIAANGILLYRNRNAPCPLDPRLAEACKGTRVWSARIFWVAIVAYLAGAFFAFVAPRL
ncbi:MAG: hypothetical protein H7301_08425 [Cryobacterium sp.]|nr:hypothetical protein [Oligoflexia bacterium]